MSTWYERLCRGGRGKDERFSVDLPLRTVTTVGVGGAGAGGGDWYFLRDGEPEQPTMAENKPPYRVPGMAEIAPVPPNGFAVVSTFSGCGGSCLGFKMAGFRVLWASEFVPAAQQTYKANHPGVPLDTRDIRRVQPQEILAAVGRGPGEIDVLEGSPPCASFSTAGKRQAGWGRVRPYSDTKQRTDDLFFEFARLLKGLQPRAFVAENVSGLVKGVAKGCFKAILGELKGCGYRVEARLLDAQWLGVPQMRLRLIFVGVRNDLGLAPAFPRPLPYRYSVRDALPWLSARDAPGDGCPLVEPEADIGRYAIGREWEKLRPGEQSERYLNLIRAHPDRPCNTLTAPAGLTSAATVVHPTEKRRFSIAELKRLCAFPDDFVLTGSYAQQWERLGRAVPPLMMFYVARTLRDEVLCKLPR